MLHISVHEPAGSSVTGSSPSPAPTAQHALRRHALATARQRELQADRATIATMQQTCRDALVLLATATERIVRSQQLLATSHETTRSGSQPPCT